MNVAHDRRTTSGHAEGKGAAIGGERGGRWRLRPWVLLALALVAFLSVPLVAHADPVTAAVTGTETRVTSDPGDQYDPSISGNKVVFTDYRSSDTDVYWYDFATGAEHPVIVALGNQELTGISGDLLVYTDYRTADVVVYDTVTGITTNVTAPDKAAVGHPFNSVDPVVSGSLVVWEDSRDGNMEIYAKNLETGEERRITDAPGIDEKPAVSGTTIVWQHVDMIDYNTNDYRYAVMTYGWSSGTTMAVSGTSPEWIASPDVWGSRIVWQQFNTATNSYDLMMRDMPSGATHVLALPGDQRNPHVSGDFVSFDDFADTYRVKLWYLPTDQVFEVGPATSYPYGRYLSDIEMTDATSGRVVYTDDRNSDLDIWSYGFSLTLLTPRIEASPSAVHFGDVPLGSSGAASVTVKNSGTGTMTVSGVGLADAGAGVAISSAPVVPVEVAPGGSFDVGLTFAPTSVGPTATALTVNSDDAAAPLLTVPIDGRATQPDIAVAPSQVQFGDVEVGKSTVALVAIQNTGNAALNVTCALGPAPAGVSLTPVTTQVEPGASYDVPLTFAPTVAGAVSGALKISTNVPGKEVVTVPITGNGVATQLPPSAMIKDLLAFYDASVASGSLTSVSSGKAGKLELAAMRAMIEAAGDLIAHNRYPLAKIALQAVHRFCDGNNRPADLVKGTARAELDTRVLAIIAKL
jgi:beta propeller repeat protein